MLTLSDEDIRMLQEIQNKATKCCPRCKNDAVWIDYGPIVGAGFYCRTCKDEVEDSANVYGTIAAAKRKQTQFQTQRPNAMLQDMACIKNGCRTCGGVTKGIDLTQVKIGSSVVCFITRGAPALRYSLTYKIVAVEGQSIRIHVPGHGDLAYTPCRFKLMQAP